MKLISIINNINSNNNSYLDSFHLNKTVKYSNDNYEIVKLLEFEGFLSEVKIIKHLSNKSINFIKNFTEFKLKPISKPGRRVFLSNKEVVSLNNTVSSIRKQLKQSKIGIKERESNYGYLYIIRTSKGIMTDKYAIKQNRGGELILKIKY